MQLSQSERVGNRADALRYRLIIEERMSRVLGNRAETSGFYGADSFRDSGTTAEPVAFSRATHVRDHLFQSRDDVKSKMSSDSDKTGTGTATGI
ncbi:hypothetical protein Enr17x_21070 [Gimesia fumaroli]|uniref:Uncharacterized protein n=1 Tax=Gimesia fumaroli TaxID=2527976 RepID=A0A518IAC1_9PLAN|nr:hypothetical protein Enr17x_21070 [Gimesia fumaroli]